jgi:hypothetical protein
MRQLLLGPVVLACCVLNLRAQVIKLQEGFETSDSVNLPAGWTKWNAASHVIDPLWNWTVRDTGMGLPGLSNATSVAHTGTKAIGASWYCTLDTNGSSFIADAWLITRRVLNIQVGDSLIFWATGGTTSYGDSIQVWIATDDSLPSSQLTLLRSILWPSGSVYGQFQRYAIDLSIAEGLDVFIGFRYHGDFATVFGFFVHLDDVFIGGPTSVNQISTTVPATFTLYQNYPNPFNPSTNIQFALPRGAFTILKVYNMLGQEVVTLHSGDLGPGTYEVPWNARGLPSGSYVCRLQAGSFVETRKLMLTK